MQAQILAVYITFPYTKVAPDWEERVANGATEPNRSWDDLVLADVTRVVFSILDKVEKIEEEEAKRRKRNKRRGTNRGRGRSKKGKHEEVVEKETFDPFAHLKPNPPTARELYVQAQIKQAEAHNPGKTRRHLEKKLKNDYNKLSDPAKEPWLKTEMVQMKIWGNLYVLYLGQGGHINCINPCPKGEKPRKNVDTYTGFDYFFAKQKRNDGSRWY